MNKKHIFSYALVAILGFLPISGFTGKVVIPPENSDPIPIKENIPQIPEVYSKEELGEIVKKASLIGKTYSEQCANDNRVNQAKIVKPKEDSNGTAYAINTKSNTNLAKNEKPVLVCLEEIKPLFKKPVIFRISHPVGAETLDFSPHRINIRLNRDGVITGFHIG